MDEIDGDFEFEDDDGLDLLDLTKEISLSMVKKISTVKSVFNKKFLVVLRSKDAKYVAQNFEDIPMDQFDKTLFGYFASYLEQSNFAYKTTGAYLSGLRCAVLHKYHDDLNFTLFNGTALWYKQLRQSLLKKYTSKCHKNKTKLTNGATKMKEDDLKILCFMLFKDTADTSGRMAALNRCLLVYQWHCMGRVSELDEVSVGDLCYVCDRFRTCIGLNVERIKTSVEHLIHLFLHVSEWIVCPFHSLASLLALSTPSGRLFEVPNQSMASHLNNVLHSLEAEWQEYSTTHDCSELEKLLTKNLTSHSARSGSATFLNCHPRLLLQWLILRGGWSMAGAMTIFAYICGKSVHCCVCVHYTNDTK